MNNTMNGVDLKRSLMEVQNETWFLDDDIYNAAADFEGGSLGLGDVTRSVGIDRIMIKKRQMRFRKSRFDGVELTITGAIPNTMAIPLFIEKE